MLSIYRICSKREFLFQVLAGIFLLNIYVVFTGGSRSLKTGWDAQRAPIALAFWGGSGGILLQKMLEILRL